MNGIQPQPLLPTFCQELARHLSHSHCSIVLPLLSAPRCSSSPISKDLFGIVALLMLILHLTWESEHLMQDKRFIYSSIQ